MGEDGRSTFVHLNTVLGFYNTISAIIKNKIYCCGLSRDTHHITFQQMNNLFLQTLRKNIYVTL